MMVTIADNWAAARALLEPEAQPIGSNHERVEMSIAISLKRIADTLESVSSHNYDAPSIRVRKV